MAPPGTLGMGGEGRMPRGGARATPGVTTPGVGGANSPPIRVTPTKSGRWGLGLSPAKKPSED